MWTNQQSLLKEHTKQEKFKPPYCAHPHCEWHFPEKITRDDPFRRHSKAKIQRWPYVTQRFRCKKCQGTFADSFFTLQYRNKKSDIYEQVHDLLRNGYSGRSVAEQLKVSEDTVRRRKKKLFRWGSLVWQKDLSKLKIKESVAYDGLENFSYSQYDPNNINHAVGRESYYVYDFNLSPMNRKGRVSPRQKAIKKQLEEEHGKYDGWAIQKDTARLFSRLLEKTDGELHLHSDNHYAYRRAIKSLPNAHRIVHAITPAKVARNFRNRLFAINHTDMLTRHHLGTFKRETIAFSKHTIGMIESFVLLAVHKNYLRPRFKKKQKRDPKAHIESPAMALGLRDKILTFKELYRTRISVHHVRLNAEWQDYFDSTDLRSRRCIRAYGGI